MPSTTRTLDPPSGLSSLPSLISLLRSKIQQRARVIPDDIDQIRQMYNTWREHDHTYWDQHHIAFGNTPYTSTHGSTKTSSTVTDVGAPAHNDIISGGTGGFETLYDRVAQLIDNFNNWVHEHFHEVEDTSV